ncbi:ATP-binding protein [Fusibacter sp. JL216-2]|uniref:ATP-binding protein n=1 Tax=Fusibacter sp. JL216-2 TaxID=3071453 RepID=UPI003D358E4F
MEQGIVKSEIGAAMKLEYDIEKDDFSRAGEASSNLKKLLKQLGIDSGIIRRIAIASYEAEINVVIHSHGGKITVFVKSDCIEVFVEDEGPGIENVELAMTEGFSTATSAIRELGFGAGMGLPNMKRCSDAFFIESKLGESTRLKMVWNL